jgi:hypothetical protein
VPDPKVAGSEHCRTEVSPVDETPRLSSTRHGNTSKIHGLPDNDRELPIGSDASDVGWGYGPAANDDSWYLRERPPHHG